MADEIAVEARHAKCGAVLVCSACGEPQHAMAPSGDIQGIQAWAGTPPWVRDDRDFTCEACGTSVHHLCDFPLREPFGSRADAPIELLAYNEPYPGVIRARREGEPSFSHVQDIGDAYMAAQSRGVRVVISQRLIDELRAAGDFPPFRPTWIDIRNDL